MNLQKKEELNKKLEILDRQILSCTKCRLCETRNQAVPGSGSWQADIMFVGEGPGRNEDLKGIPFVGAAGKFLDEMLDSIGLKRDDIFITNVVKCRPPNNRDPRPDEIEACLPYLRMQTKLINPKVICTMGNPAGRTLVSKDIGISKYHGRFFEKKGFVFNTLYHPAAALYNGSLRQTLMEDFKRLGLFLSKIDNSEQKIEKLEESDSGF